MTIWRIVLKEIAHRKLAAMLTSFCLAIAVGSVIAAVTVLNAHDARTERILELRQEQTRAKMAELDDDMRKAMLNLGFNIVVLPAEQSVSDWYAEDSGRGSMPEEYVQRLAKANIVTVQHILPVLQQKVLWPERKRTIILVGTRGELPGGGKAAMVHPVPPGTIALGYELHESLNLQPGGRVVLMGREFTVGKCYGMRGNKDDITAWIDLASAQEMLDRKGQINAILALECSCAWADLPKVRQEISRILPGTQIVERGGEALARAEARRLVAREAQAAMLREQTGRAQLRTDRERLASVLVPSVVVACIAVVGMLAYFNSRQRRSEIGLFRAIGLHGRQIMLLFIAKSAILGAVGGALGCLVGYLAGRWIGDVLDAGLPGGAGGATLNAAYAAIVLIGAPVLAVVAGWIPAVLAARQDPAVVLREE